MTFRSLAISSIRGNWRAYNAFFLSSVFSVIIFYMYGAFLFHPDVINGHIEAAAGVRKGMEACQYIVVIFSFFFVLYANSAFLKTRKKEFGLYTLFGMTGNQLRRMLVIESVIIAVLAIAAGLGIGMLLSKLFFMAMASLLGVESPIRFAVPLKAVLLTVIGYFALFNVLTWLTSIRVGRSEIIELLKEANQPKRQPLYSMWLTILSILCLGLGYTLAYIMNTSNVIFVMLPILGLVIIGSYFLFTQCSVALIRMVQRSKSIFYNRTNMIIFSQVAYKLKDNARILFMVSILSAVILTASGTVYAFQQEGEKQLLSHTPQTIGFVENGLNAHNVLDPAKLKSILKQDGRELAYETRLVGIPGEEVTPAEGHKTLRAQYDSAIVSESDYNQVAGLMNRPRLSIDTGHARVVFPYIEQETLPPFEGPSVTMKVNGTEQPFSVDGYLFGAIISPIDYFTTLIVVDDTQYGTLLAATPESRQIVNYGFEIKDWQTALPTAEKIEKLIPPSESDHAMTYRVSSFLQTHQSSSLTLFVGLFVSLLFFIASGSVLYFKLFTEMKEDQLQFRALTRIGMTAGEIRRIVATQVGIIFYVPVVVGIIHMCFAMKALSTLMQANIWIYAGTVIGIYVIMQSIYFAVACTGYTKRMLNPAV
ncbi:FtsX-like permease family protein [Paenibacillus sepulcri]|uniref:FtsX-like permease family protein n=1 Tax=Paenibacillus sepulcri TaxID=359917 RepID=A0ABS7C2C9_9BACL|nr:FtsX-like permease family protein [Paenibacillus sepulcri]